MRTLGMQQEQSRRWVLATMLAVSFAGAAHGADQFMKPTAEELSMTSLPGYPGASAVVLYREERDDDEHHSVLHYERIKILTEEGKKYANVQLRFVSFITDEAIGNSASVESISGRTIHSDGTIIPLTTKPYLKVVEKSGGVKFQERVFTLPDVQVGSIIEYRYAERSENFFSGPAWYLQGDLFVRSAHYTWLPTRLHLTDDDTGKDINAIASFPILPPGAKMDSHETPTADNQPGSGSQRTYDLVVKDVPPITQEDFMPPIASYSYRVLFSFTPYRSGQEYWAEEGKSWSKHANAFMNGGSSLQDATAKITAGAATQEAKLQKIYAAVMALENTEYSREHGQREDKAAGLGKVSNATDIMSHQRGSPYQLTELFVAMARVTGMKAYLALVPDREERLFTPGWLRMSQLDSPIAIVSVDGKDRFFDPGERYCAFGHLAWQHTWVQGMRQTESGTDFFQTSGDSQAVNHTGRVANLKLAANNEVSGKIDITYSGAAALRWRQAALRGDEESTQHGLRVALEQMVPKSLEVKVSSIDGLTDYDAPLAVHYSVSGTLGTPTGKRLMVPVDLFQASSSATFPHDTRELPVYFHFPQAVQDAVRVGFDPSLAVEAIPESSKATIPSRAVYSMTVQQGTDYFVARRNYVFGDLIVKKEDYGTLRTFYSQFEAKDQESVVLKAAPENAATASVKPAAN